MMRVALAMRGKPFRYQGETPAGFDASGLVYYCHKQAGLDMPRDFRDQLSQSTPVDKARIRPGDLVFFSLGSTHATHVGIYLGVNKFVHAPPNHDKVILSDLSKGFWAEHLVRGGRYRFK
jgi:cell wall-associated NlpC family hydrolase